MTLLSGQDKDFYLLTTTADVHQHVEARERNSVPKMFDILPAATKNVTVNCLTAGVTSHCHSEKVKVLMVFAAD